jgi:hypothetical protein
VEFTIHKACKTGSYSRQQRKLMLYFLSLSYIKHVIASRHNDPNISSCGIRKFVLFRSITCFGGFV